ncbi:MAG: AAA family ATPase [Myxococcaceae bacterium]|nr:AAA family ATPase [Myxococcaceae bacterium]
MTPPQNPATDELGLLVAVLPERLQGPVRALPEDELLEVVLDLGRPPEARLVGRSASLGDVPISHADLAAVLARVGPLGEDNRAGIERTLHRISALRNRRGEVVGLTLRVGRALTGTVEVLRDLIGTGLSLLLLGPPGVGKTTKLREVARVLSSELGKRVMVVDTSNEIGGDGDIPHAGIGSARRMQVSRPERQHAVMIEAVENHMPEVIIVDEIGTEADAAAARTIAERGVQLVGTAHGNTLENIILNPTLSDLVGGVHVVTLSDEEARRRGTSKTVRERRAPPTFDMVVEMVNRDEVRVHRDTAAAVDGLLAGRPTGGERRLTRNGQLEVEPERPPETAERAVAAGRATAALGVGERRGPLRIHPHAVSRELLERVLRNTGANARVVARPDAADIILALKSRADEPRIRRAAERPGVVVHALKRSTATEMRRVLRQVFPGLGGLDESEVRQAVQEAEQAIRRVLTEGVTVSLAPRPPRLRKLQHGLFLRHHLESRSVGSEPTRHLVVAPTGVMPQTEELAPNG